MNPAGSDTSMTLLDYFFQGGPLMWPILLCSVGALAVGLERLWALRLGKLVPRNLLIEAEDLIAREKYPESLTLCRKYDSPLGRVLAVAVQNQGKSRGVIKELLEEAGRREAALLERFIPVLTVIISIAPLLGLLGTVQGMIKLFNTMEVTGTGDMSYVAQGIATALLTTFGGLAVAIPAIVIHRYLLSRVDNALLIMEDASLRILEMVKAPEGP